ncbi:MAG: hypothetical protein OXF84_07365 [Bacteroidetes bacterium]|nr:hypothetical protein [Bacteroidota bacterium]
MDKNSDLEFSRISHLLRKAGLDSDEANELTERIKNMAASSFKTEFDSFKESMNTKYNLLIWIVGILAGAGVFNVLSNFFDWGA